MYNLAEFIGSQATVDQNIQDLSLADMEVLMNEEAQATIEFRDAEAKGQALWERFEALSELAAVTAHQAESNDKATGTAFHFAGIAAHNATKDLPDNVRQINAFESADEGLDLVQAGEDFKSIIQAIWNGIKKQRDKAWRFLKRMWSKSVGRYARLRRSLVSLQEKSDKVMTNGFAAENANVDVTSGIPSFHLGGKVKNQPDALLSAYRETVDATKYFYGSYLDKMKKGLPAVEGACDGRNVEDVRATSISVGKALTKLRRELVTGFTKQFPASTGVGIPDVTHISSTAPKTDMYLYALLGDVVIASQKDSTNTEEQLVSAVTTSIYGIYDWSTKKKNYPDSITLPVATPDQARTFATSALEAVDQILATLGKSELDKLSDVAGKINKALDKYKNEVAKVGDSKIAKDTSTIASILGATRKVDSWLTGITSSMGSNYASQTAAIASYMSKSMSQYK